MTWREEQIGDCRLILADCRDVTLLSAATIICDPPYGINYNHFGAHARFSGVGLTKAARERGNWPIIGDDKPFDPSPWLEFSNVILWGADHFHQHLRGGRWLAFDKLAGMPPWDSFCDVEFAWHSRPGAARLFSFRWKGIACDKRGEANGLREHPTQKPIALMRWCIEQSGAASGSLIVDPYMGSGTTGIACSQLGYPFIGIEMEPKYFDIACRRIEQAYRQGDLIRDIYEKPQQIALL